MKYTPKPWKAKKYAAYAGAATEDDRIGIFAGDKQIAMLKPPNWQERAWAHEFEDNAKLIESAPEMLDALIEAQELIRRLVDEGFIHPNDLSAVGNCQANMFTAIDKAKTV